MEDNNPALLHTRTNSFSAAAHSSLLRYWATLIQITLSNESFPAAYAPFPSRTVAFERPACIVSFSTTQHLPINSTIEEQAAINGKDSAPVPQPASKTIIFWRINERQKSLGDFVQLTSADDDDPLRDPSRPGCRDFPTCHESRDSCMI
jgi:hypothetical protein